jgi:replicative DNA helicase
MSAKGIVERVASDAANYTIEEDRFENFPEHKKKIYDAKLAELTSIENLKMIDFGMIPVEEMLGGILATDDFDLIIIDNFDRIGASKGVTNGYEADNLKIKTLLSFTQEKQIPIMLVHHINSKRPEKKGGYGLSDLRGSGKITDECDTVLFLSRDIREGISDDEKAKFFIQAKKHRRKGQLLTTSIKFVEGGFEDNHEPWKTPEWWSE